MAIDKRILPIIIFVLVGILLILLGAYSQISQQHPQPPKVGGLDLGPRLRNSLLMQSRNFQRCWLQGATNPTEQVWQIFVAVQPDGKVSQFKILNPSSLESSTLKCLTDTGYRLKFPTFEGENFSFTVPVVMTRINENR
jgi:hypothetical protein